MWPDSEPQDALLSMCGSMVWLLGMKVVDDNVESCLERLSSESSVHFLSYFLSKLECFLFTLHKFSVYLVKSPCI